MNAADDPVRREAETVAQVRGSRGKIDAELSKTIVGQSDVIEQLLICLFAGGHCLVTGAPGLAKTLLVRSLAQIFDLKFQRIQFTPDLMPADITGTEILEQLPDGQRRLQFVKGAIFGNVILADEINRTPPKTQSALLEAMQEHQVTVAGRRYELDEPFFVLATQNPIEMEGTYPLPEAQLDRFMFNVLIDYLPEDDEVAVVLRTTSRSSEKIEPLFTGADVRRFHQVVQQVPIAEEVVRYAVRQPPPAGRDVQARRASSTTGSPGERERGLRSNWCWGRRRGRCWPGGRRRPPPTCERWFTPRSATAFCPPTAPKPKGWESRRLSTACSPKFPPPPTDSRRGWLPQFVQSVRQTCPPYLSVASLRRGCSAVALLARSFPLSVARPVLCQRPLPHSLRHAPRAGVRCRSTLRP